MRLVCVCVCGGEKKEGRRLGGGITIKIKMDNFNFYPLFYGSVSTCLCLKKMAEKQTVTVTVDKNVAEASRPFLVNVCFVF